MEWRQNKKLRKKVFFTVAFIIIGTFFISSYLYLQKGDSNTNTSYKKELGIKENSPFYKKIKGNKVYVDKVKEINEKNKYLILNSKAFPYKEIKGLKKDLIWKNVLLFVNSKNEPFKINELKKGSFNFKEMNSKELSQIINSSENEFIKIKGLQEGHLPKKKAISFLQKILNEKTITDKTLTYPFLSTKNWKKIERTVGPITKGVWVIFYKLKNWKNYINTIIVNPYYTEKDKEIYRKYYQNNSILRDERLKEELFSSYHNQFPLIFY